MQSRNFIRVPEYWVPHYEVVAVVGHEYWPMGGLGGVKKQDPWTLFDYLSKKTPAEIKILCDIVVL